MYDLMSSAALGGRWEVERYCRLCGEKLPTLRGENTILDAGKQEFLDIMFHIGSPAASQQFDNGSTQVKIYDSGDVLKTTLSCKSGYPLHGSEDTGLVYFWFEDLTADVYEADRIDFLNVDSSVIFSRKDPTAFGTKPSTENWIYKYTLSITQNGDGDLSMDALDHALRMFTGDRSISQGWDSSSWIYIEASGGSPNTTEEIDGGYPSRSGETVTMVFTSEAGGDLISWYDVSIRALMVDPSGNMDLSSTTESLGTKGSSEVWEYTFTFSL
jgi:hypothetical protein